MSPLWSARMVHSRDIDDDWDDRPRQKPRGKKARPSTAVLIALGAGLGVLILLLMGGVGAVIHYSGGQPFSLGGVLPHPALAKPATADMFGQVMNEEPFASTERKLGSGCPLTMAEAEAIIVPFQGADMRWAGPSEVSLKAFGQRPSGNAQITQWYQWG